MSRLVRPRKRPWRGLRSTLRKRAATLDALADALIHMWPRRAKIVEALRALAAECREDASACDE